MKKGTINTKDNITIFLSMFALLISGFTLYQSMQPDDTTLTVKSSKLEKCLSSPSDLCYKVFIYNNNKAPCFDFKLDYETNTFERILFLKGYEKSSIFNADYDGRTISFPAMNAIPIQDKWLGYLNRKEIAYFTFYPNKNSNTKKKITITCVDYKKEIILE